MLGIDENYLTVWVNLIKKGYSVQLDKIISSAKHPIETAFNNTSAIQELSYYNQCTNVGPFLRQLVANR